MATKLGIPDLFRSTPSVSLAPRCAIAWCVALLLPMVVYTGAANAATDASQRASQSISNGAAGTLRTLGAYPQERGVGHTVTALPDGRMFVYGHSFSGTSIDKIILDPKLRVAKKDTLSPLMWDPTGQAWRKIENPPECQFMAYLHTATALADGRILIAGGLCDVPRRRDDDRPHHQHKELSLWNDTSKQWEVAPSLFEARLYHSATLLKDNSVLFVGGESDVRTQPNTEPVLDSVELFHDGKISQLAHLRFARAKHTATRMVDNFVMVVGGIGKDGKATATVEVWDPIKKIWHDGPALNTARQGHTASLLDDGRLFVAGGVDRLGESLSSVEIFDPVKKLWAETAPLLMPLRRLSAVVLGDSNVLVAGIGFDRDHPYSEIMLWEHATGKWRPAGQLIPDRYQSSHFFSLIPAPLQKGHALVFDSQFVMQWSPVSNNNAAYPPYRERRGYANILLKDGRIMRAGGHTLLPGGRAGRLGLDWVDIFDPVSGRFSITGRMNAARHSLSAVVLDDGRVVVTSYEWSGYVFDRKTPLPLFAEIWDPNTDQWTIIHELQGADINWKNFEQFGKLRDGRVLFIFSGGSDSAPEYRALFWDPRNDAVEIKQVGAINRVLPSIAITADGLVLIVNGASHKKADDIVHPEVWNSRTGNVEQLPFPPDWFMHRATKVLVLKNGNVLWMNMTYSKPETASMAIWHAPHGTWEKLPPLPIDKSWEATTRNLIELNDGTIITDSVWLRPGALSWSPVQRFPQEEASMTQLPTGELLALSSSPPYIAYFNDKSLQWQIDAPYYLPRKKQLKPTLLELADGRVMVSGSLDLAGHAKETISQIWNPNNNTWLTTGKLLGIYSNLTQAVRLPSGQVMHLSIDGNNLNCEIGHPSDNLWNDCGASTPLIKSRTQFSVGSLADKRIVLMFGQGEAYSYNEQQHQWLPFSGDTSGIELHGPQNDSFKLPDGCLISGPPFRIVNPTTGKELRPSLPVTGIAHDYARMIVLADGTVVVAGYPQGANGPNHGFFHRKASCAGFEVQVGDKFYMPPAYWTAPPLPTATPVATDVSTSQRFFIQVMQYKWLPVAIIVPVLLYWFLRKVILRVNAANPKLVLPGPAVSVTRAVFYLFSAIVTTLLFIAWPARLPPDKVQSSTSPPCRYVGIWSASRSGSEYRLTLTDDGRFATEPIRDGAGVTRVHTGAWEVYGDTMRWRYDNDPDITDINPIRHKQNSTFTLIEDNGEHTKFQLLEKIDSSSCAP